MEIYDSPIAERFAFAEPYLSIPEIRMVFVNAAKERGIKALTAPGLPGKTAPKTAGYYIAEAIIRAEGGRG